MGLSNDPFFSADSDLDMLDMDKMDLDKKIPLGFSSPSSTPKSPSSIGLKSIKLKKPMEKITKERQKRRNKLGR